MKQIQSEKGAVLILVLFLVVFLSIAGTMMLTSTSYNERTMLTDVKVQEEFYQAEGALDIVLDELSENAYVYLESILTEDGKPMPNSPYKMGADLIQVTASSEKQGEIKVNDLVVQETINGTITANLVHEPKIYRELQIEATKFLEVIESYFGAGKVVNFIGGNVDVSTKQVKLDDDEITKINLTQYQDVVKKYTNLLNNRSSIVVDGITIKRVSSLSDPYTIKENHVYLVDTLEHTGGGTITVDGLLIVDYFRMNGNPTLNVNTGVIAKDFVLGGKGNPQTPAAGQGISVQGQAQGIPCNLLTETLIDCRKVTENVTHVYGDTITYGNEVISYETKRK